MVSTARKVWDFINMAMMFGGPAYFVYRVGPPFSKVCKSEPASNRALYECRDAMNKAKGL